MDRLLEKDVERILTAEVRKAGGRSYKWVSPGNDGVPDRIVMFPGGDIEFVELKTESGRLSELQKKQIKRIEDFGLDVSVAYGVKGVARMLEYNGYISAANRIEQKYGKEKWYDKGKYVFRGKRVE